MSTSATAQIQTIKLLLIGDSGVGKSSILRRFIDDKFLPPEQQTTTIGVDYQYKIIEKDGRKIKLAIWDTAGQEKFKTVTASYYRGSQGVVVVYDVCQRESFDNLRYWLRELDTHSTNPNIVKIIVGNKIDKAEEEDSQATRQVSKEEGREFARLHSALFIETSAKTKAGLLQCFDELVENVLQQQETQLKKANEPSINIGNSGGNSTGGALGICGC